MRPSELWEGWRAKAAELRELDATGQASSVEWCADALEEWWRTRETEPLTLQEAAAESGYSYSGLQQLVSDGKLRNIGRRNSPRVCRQDMPRKPRGPQHLCSAGAPDVAGEILARRVAS
jgi:hypothetical protein